MTLPLSRPAAVRTVGMVIGTGCWLALGSFGGLILTATAPQLFGWHTTVVDGESMSPTIARGDVVITRPDASGLRGTGQVILFRSPDHPGKTTLHRVRANKDGWLVTQGDHNRDPDTAKVPASAVVGRAVLRIPWIGLPMIWAGTGNWLPLLACVAIILVMLLIAGRVADQDTIPYEDAVHLLDAA